MGQPREVLDPRPIARKPKPDARKTELERHLDTLLTTQRGFEFKAFYVGAGQEGFNGEKWEHDKWTCVFTRKGKTQSFEYRTGTGHREKGRVDQHSWTVQVRPVPPSAADVLYCLTSDALSAQQTFQSWCAELGYDSDSRRAEKTYFACQEVSDKLTKLFSLAEIEEMRNAEH